jgi:hypothetical protein
MNPSPKDTGKPLRYDYYSLLWKDSYSDKIQQRHPTDAEAVETEWTVYVEVSEADAHIEALERKLAIANKALVNIRGGWVVRDCGPEAVYVPSEMLREWASDALKLMKKADAELESVK